MSSSTMMVLRGIGSLIRLADAMPWHQPLLRTTGLALLTLRDLLSLVRDPGGPHWRTRGVAQILLSSAQPKLQPSRISARIGKPAADRTARSSQTRTPSAEQGAEHCGIAGSKISFQIFDFELIHGQSNDYPLLLRRYREACSKAMPDCRLQMIRVPPCQACTCVGPWFSQKKHKSPIFAYPVEETDCDGCHFSGQIGRISRALPSFQATRGPIGPRLMTLQLPQARAGRAIVLAHPYRRPCSYGSGERCLFLWSSQSLGSKLRL